MPRNLEHKITNLLDDIETMSRAESIRKIKVFIEEEIKFLNEEHKVGRFDLIQIKSEAMRNYKDRDPRRCPDHDTFIAECYLDAIMQYMKSKGYVNFKLKCDRDKY